MNTRIAQETARLLLSIEAVSFRFDPPFTYTSGLKSPIYLDNRLVLSYPDVRSKIIQLCIQVIEKQIGFKNVECISGTATAAIPHASVIADHLGVPLVYARSSAKSYGKEQKLEGTLQKGSKVLIVEDHISTGASSIDNAQTVRALGGTVDYCIATTTYETEISQQNFAQHNIELLTLTTGRIIIQEAKKKKMVTTKEAASIHAWFDSPTDWGHRNE